MNRSSSGSVQSLLRRNARNGGLLIAIIAILIYVGSQQSYFLTWDNAVVVLMQMSFIGIASLSTAGLIISGNVDLSIGSLYGLTAVVAAIAAKSMDPFLAVAVALAVGTAVGLINGALVWRIKISPIIITLGSLTLLHGLVLLLTGGYSVTGVPESFEEIGSIEPLGLPLPILVWALLLLIAFVVLQRSTVGTYTYAVGGNREAAEAAGIKIRRLVLTCFALNGLLIGMVGVLAATRYGTADPTMGTGFELDVITAVILGGVAFSGGEGGIGGVTLAVILIGVLNAGVVALGIDPFYTDVIKGAVLIIAVFLDQLSVEQRDKLQSRRAMRDVGEAAEELGAAN